MYEDDETFVRRKMARIIQLTPCRRCIAHSFELASCGVNSAPCKLFTNKFSYSDRYDALQSFVKKALETITKGEVLPVDMVEVFDNVIIK